MEIVYDETKIRCYPFGVTPYIFSAFIDFYMPAFLCDELREYIDMLYFPDPNQRIFAITKSKLTHRFHKLSEEAGLRRIIMPTRLPKRVFMNKTQGISLADRGDGAEKVL
ncbi:MAG TPA: hypothetical protein IAC57_05685 [Candidatus Scatosoma pullistercoris]|uniref:Uncharacterized protein n=1 Tax=Candidatus Scatosoma pullistercoris TaxID=2840934 RepID=A0A9D1MG86_9FIRM|nr:hypothetical protein [Candidatus Scatosoma pullistercoris]